MTRDRGGAHGRQRDRRRGAPGRRAARRSRSSRRRPARCSALRRALAARGRRRGGRRPPRPRSPPGRRGRSRSAAAILRRIAQLLERDRERGRARSSPPRPASRRRTRGARPTARSSSATSSPARAGASTARRCRARPPNRQAMTIRQPLGVAGLIIAANTPIANVAWKVFPALLCGNAAVLKASEDTPETALAFARLAAEAGLPAGVLNVVQGFGEEAGQPLVEDPRVAVVSLHRLDRRRPHDRPRRRRAPRQGLPRARRQEPARRLRRRRPRAGGRGGGAVGLLERRPALRRRARG